MEKLPHHRVPHSRPRRLPSAASAVENTYGGPTLHHSRHSAPAPAGAPHSVAQRAGGCRACGMKEGGALMCPLYYQYFFSLFLRPLYHRLGELSTPSRSAAFCTSFFTIPDPRAAAARARRAQNPAHRTAAPGHQRLCISVFGSRSCAPGRRSAARMPL